MLGLDERLTELAGGRGLAVALAVAVLLGLRHATDPDHLTAVSVLVLAAGERGARRAAGLGLAWGLGHAVTLLAFGLPVVLLGRTLPEGVQRVAELVIGIVIIALGARLLWRWRRGYLHVHPHAHDGRWHAHPHVHERRHEHAGHAHGHADRLGRTPAAAFGIGLVHGVGGSAGVGVLLVGGISNDAEAVVALALFALAAAASMGIASGLFGGTLAHGRARRRFERAAPAFGSAAVLFGGWYALAALSAVPYLA